MTNYCKCGGKIALCYGVANFFEPDSEPFDNGFYDKVDEKLLDSGDLRTDGVGVNARVCIECKKIFGADVSESFNEEYDKTVDRDVLEKKDVTQ